MLYVRNERSRKGFTLVELVIVIGIIALLMGILVPVVSKVRVSGQMAASNAQLRNLSMAITEYHTTFKAYPGYFNEEKFQDDTDFTSTENMTLSLLGGAKHVDDDFDNRSNLPDMANEKSPNPQDYNVDLTDIGKGPKNSVSRRSYGAFYAYQADEVAVIQKNDETHNNMPELVDKVTGLPILYYRFRSGSQVNGVYNSNQRYRVAINVNDAYLSDGDPSTNYGSILKTAAGDQYPQWGSSLIHANSPDFDDDKRLDNFATIFRNNKLSDPITTHLYPDGDNNPNSGGGDIITGGYALIAPGPDGIYFNEKHNVYRSPNGEDDLDLPATTYNKQDTFDDIVIIGGSD